MPKTIISDTSCFIILGIIPSIKPLLDKIRQTDFRTTDIELQALKEAKE